MNKKIKDMQPGEFGTITTPDGEVSFYRFSDGSVDSLVYGMDNWLELTGFSLSPYLDKTVTISTPSVKCQFAIEKKIGLEKDSLKTYSATYSDMVPAAKVTFYHTVGTGHIATEPKYGRASCGYVVRYILDTCDIGNWAGKNFYIVADTVIENPKAPAADVKDWEISIIHSSNVGFAKDEITIHSLKFKTPTPDEAEFFVSAEKAYKIWKVKMVLGK